MTDRLRIGVTGATGLLGAHLCARLSRDHDVVGLDRHPWWGDQPLDLRVGELDDAAYRTAFWRDVKPHVLIHGAAMLDVDECERAPERAYAANDRLTGELVRERAAGCVFIYVSTDAVFAGTAPWATELDLPCPPNVYGRSKLHGEWNVQLGASEHAIVRTNFFGWSSGRKKTSAEWLFGALERAEPIRLFDDFYFSPIYVADLAESVAQLIEQRLRGVFHIAGHDRVTKLEFGQHLAQAAGLALDGVSPASMRTAGFAAPRAGDLSLTSAKFAAAVGQPPPRLPEGIARFLADRRVPLSTRGVVGRV